MTTGKADLAKAIADAVTESTTGSAPEGTTVEGTAAGKAPEAKTEGTEGTPAPKEDGTEVEAVASEEVEAFQKRYGVDLSTLPDDEARAKFITEFRETNKTINKLQRENAELKKEPAKPEPVAAPEPQVEAVDMSQVTDAQLAEALGIDLQTADDRDMREIGMTRTLLELQDRLDRTEKSVTESTRTSRWDKAFDELEGQFGDLPDDISREDVYAYANAEGISNPEAAYWAAVGPVRAAVSQALNKQIVELRTATKKAATSLRPGSKAETEDKLESKNVKDAIAEAFALAQKKLNA